MPLWNDPPSRMPTDRTPTPQEFVTEAVRRRAFHPKAHMIAEATVQIVCSVRGWHPNDPDLDKQAALEHLRMGALLGQLVDERLEVWLPEQPAGPPEEGGLA
jgi:hypothetical protein